MNDCLVGAKKDELRRLYRSKRDRLSEEFRKRASRTISYELQKLEVYQRAPTVMFYCTHGSEVPTDEMIEQALAQGKNVAVPLVAPDHWEIVAARITSLRDDVRPGTYGIREPDLQRCRLFRPEEIDLVLVPGIVFDGHGHRLGYGKGFYDRWLGHFPVKQRIGIAFDFQVVKKLPTGINDLPVSLIITEKRTIKTKRSKERCVTIAPNVMKHFERSKR